MSKHDRTETPNELELRQWAQAQAGGPSYHRINGAAHGVIASATDRTELNRSPLALLRVDASPEVHELALRVVQDVFSAAGPRNNDSATLPDFTRYEDFAEWLAGLGAVAMAEPDVMFTMVQLWGATEGAHLKGKDARAVREVSEQVMFLLCMTPPEFLPSDLAPQALQVMEQVRQGSQAEKWDVAWRREAAVEALDTVHMAYTTMRLVDDLPEGGFVPVRREGRKIRPNEPCPCGSGKKYKKCHGAPGAPALLGLR